jgi:hypothetical protein
MSGWASPHEPAHPDKPGTHQRRAHDIDPANHRQEPSTGAAGKPQPQPHTLR